ncbi:MAG: toprim domain-containing protein [Euryarchaeota archaeon]|nr:toprim domain-containing protein [Euryarchaeota archaeon]MBU4222634.1 toprim domain-containing protein [Euryarchaeota archaeon]MCG2738123.1 toprim domain-containing protein [Candidatus Methanoperedenaceae archaeon]
MNIRTLEDIERLEKLEGLILELQVLSDTGAIIIVEGRKDVESLRSLGVNGEIKLSSQKPLLDFTEQLSRRGKDIVLLTDWDRKGGMVARKIIDYLHAYGIMPNTDIRARIGFLVKKRIKDVESLSRYIGKLRYELHGTD